MGRAKAADTISRSRGAIAPELCISGTLQKSEGAGNAGRRPRPWPASKQKAGGRYHRFSQIIRHSLRDGFNAYIALSLGTGLSCSHRPRSSRELGLSVGRPGPHDFASASAPFVRAKQSRAPPMRPSHPASRVVTIAHTPLMPRRDARIMLLIWGWRQAYFRKSELGHCDKMARRAVRAWRVCAICPSCSPGVEPRCGLP